MSSTSAVDTSIQAVSAWLIAGAGCASCACSHAASTAMKAAVRTMKYQRDMPLPIFSRRASAAAGGLALSKA